MGRKTHSDETITKVFNKARKVSGEHPSVKRMDRYNKIIDRSAYGNRNSGYGWDIHHKDKNPNNNSIDNLEALHYDSHNSIHQ